MQRILQRGEIEAIDQINFPRIRLPELGSLFAERAARLRQLAVGNPIADYILFVARIVDAQHQALATLPAPTLPADAMALAQQHSMPLMPAAEHLDPAWLQVLDSMLSTLEGAQGLPAPLQPLITALREMPEAEREAVAKRLLHKEVAARDVGMAPFVMAALQVTFAQRAAHLAVGDVPYTEPASICPVCASEPVASVLRIGGKANGHRYLHCGTCCSEWHMVRVKCSHCESTKGIQYQGVEGLGEVVSAETCSECGSYRKVINQEKDPLAEPLADDLASLMLDLLMSETRFKRASTNPLLYVVFAEEQAEGDASLVDPAAQ